MLILAAAIMAVAIVQAVQNARLQRQIDRLTREGWDYPTYDYTSGRLNALWAESNRHRERLEKLEAKRKRQ
jgi:hypothetical protein